MRRLSWLCALALAGSAWAAEGGGDAPQFDKNSYPPLTLAQAAAKNPCRLDRAAYEIKDKLFSTEVVYQGAQRDTPKKHFELVRRWAKQLGDPDAADRYKKEISLSEGKKVHWLPVPEGLLPILESDLRPGDRATAYLVFVGCVDRTPLFTLDEFEAEDASGDEDEDVIVYNYLPRRGAPPPSAGTAPS